MEQLKAIILAAGKGTRMKSELPKVVHRIDGQCLVDYVIDAAKGAGAKDICLVVGYKHEVVEAEISHQDVQYVLQTEQLGTGHAVMMAKEYINDNDFYRNAMVDCSIEELNLYQKMFNGGCILEIRLKDKFSLEKIRESIIELVDNYVGLVYIKEYV